jgi:hypothetical protein
MIIEWSRTEARYECCYGKTGTRFSAQISLSTNPGRYVWTIFHDDFRYCVWGDEVDTVDEAKRRPEEWLAANTESRDSNSA